MQKRRFLPATILTIFLGAIGSALWDISKPFSGKFTDILFNIITLGITKIQNGIYLDVARGFHESLSLEVYLMMMSVFFSIMIIILIVKRYEKITFWAYKFMIKNEEINRSKSLKIVLYFYLIFVFTASAFQISKAIFINESITQYQQLKSSISPYIDNQEILLIDSSFSRIKNKNDYEVLINKMEEIEKQSSSADLGL